MRTSKQAARLLIAAAFLGGCQAPAPPTAPVVVASTVAPTRSMTPTPPAAATTEAAQTLSQQLDRLVVAPEHLDGYDRDLFPVWDDADGDGCNTRYEVLLEEAVQPPVVSGSCDLTGGLWISPYDGVELHDATDVQIDHLVALAEAWYSGAYAWTTERRERFANDLGTPWELNAVSGPINEAKAAADPAEWLPPERSAICPYLEAWIGTKVRWSLLADGAEAEALRRLVKGCPEDRFLVPIVPMDS